MSRWPFYVLVLAWMYVACTRTEVVPSFPDSYVGVGMELRIEDNLPEVVRTLAGGSARDAGVEPGDRIVMIDGHPTINESLGDIVMRIRGRPESQVTLALDRGKERLIIVVRRRKMTKQGEKDYDSAEKNEGRDRPK